MENDLYFCLIEPDSWKSVTQTGNFIPDSFAESGFINCYLSNDVETVANTTYTDETELLLVVIDPLRIHSPIKKEKEGETSVLKLSETFSIDAIIDRIRLKKSKKGRFSIHIKHFD